MAVGVEGLSQAIGQRQTSGLLTSHTAAGNSPIQVSTAVGSEEEVPDYALQLQVDRD
ncbi:unnamed protein product [Protopolystoma xenopodis]|uniref:Uncharacterized protein n=1 Tax=Protopolystoma xenopodis TaxID=117903 RepID=A0A3S5AAB3_9PLAT|nr:unnamed protein product [Protopolystoma xenopodis]